MTNAVKASLLSALLLPGTGHVSVNHKKTGYSIIAVFLVFVGILITKILKIAETSLKKIQAEGGTINMVEINKAANDAVQSSNQEGLLGTLVIIMLVLWLFSIVDSFRLGRKLDLEENS